MKKYTALKWLRPTFFRAFLSICFLLALQAVNGQNNARIKGRIVLVDNTNNTLIIKLQVQAIHDTDPGKILKLGTGSLWVRYNDSLVSMAEQPIQASNINLTDGDYFYPMLASANYTQKKVIRQSKPDDIKMTSLFSISHFVYELPASTPPIAEPINSWTDIAVFKYKIIKSGNVQLKWNVLAMDKEIKDEAEASFGVNKADFEDWSGYVTYHQPTLILNAVGSGSSTDPYFATITSFDAILRQAGTAGFRLYYSSDEVNTVTYADQLSKSPFQWNNAIVLDESIPEIWKNGELYDRLITFTSNDNFQGNDYWPAANTATPVKLLELTFAPNAGNLTDFTTHLEVIGQESFKTWDRTINHIVLEGSANNPGGGPNSPLPVSLANFTATLQNPNSVLLNWSTANEKDNDRFVVERSANGKNFETVATVKGNGTSNSYISYETTDNNALTGISYYRLKQVDFNGKSEYSKIVTVKNTLNTEALRLKALYPNPAHKTATLEFLSAADEKISLTITDVLGKVVREQVLEGHSGQNKIELENLAYLHNGIYIISLSNSSQLVYHKLVKE
jgi:hypothetical protein